jgi:hypothetical protein
MANIATSQGASAPVTLTVTRLEETRRHPNYPEKISLDVEVRADNGKGVFFILSPELRQRVPWKVGDRLKAVGAALYHPALPDVDLFSDFKPWPLVPLRNIPALPAKEKPMNIPSPIPQHLTISDTDIRQDESGRFCLNDLHKAAGGEKRHAPNEWLRNQQTQDLIDALGDMKPGIAGILSKQGLGTFVCRELVYAYAMWISPAFHLKVIRAYDMLASLKQVSLAASQYYDQLPKTFSEALRLAATEMEKREEAEARALEAEKTKSLIGSKREASAMATASVKSREAEKLKIELDQSKQYATVKRMEMLYHGQKFNWRLLKSTGIEMGMEAIDVFDANYGTVKAWPAEVWKEAFALDIPD